MGTGKGTKQMSMIKRRVTIDSKDICEYHSLSFFYSADIVDGKIVSLYEEAGRSGGEIWSQKFSGGKELQEHLDNFDSLFYGKVYKAAYAESLDPVSKVIKRVKQKKIKRAEEKVADIGKAYINALKELKKLQK